MAAYMSFPAVTTYLGIDPTDLYPHCKMIDGHPWLPTNVIRTRLSGAAFRKMECHVTTWVPDETITDDMREAHRQEKAEFELQCGGYDTSGYL